MMTGTNTEQQKLLKKISRKAGVTMRDHQMVSSGDHVLLGLSGGKDSMILLEVMADRKSAMPFDFKLTAAHIRVADIGYQAELHVMQEHCEKLGIDFIVKDTAIGESDKKQKGICFLCSWNRRKALFDLTRELNCNKLVLGHHRNDALETLLLNMIYHGSISSMPYTLKMFDGRVELIRPLLDMNESLLHAYADLRAFNAEGEKCTHETSNHRDEIRKMMAGIEELHGPGPHNMFRAMDKIFSEYLPQKKARTS